MLLNYESDVTVLQSFVETVLQRMGQSRSTAEKVKYEEVKEMLASSEFLENCDNMLKFSVCLLESQKGRRRYTSHTHVWLCMCTLAQE